MSKSVTIFTHKAIEGPARLVDILDRAGFAQTHILTSKADLTDFDALVPDLLVVMGGPMGVYEAERYPYLTHEIEIIKARIAAGKPVLGVCLGAQLIAAALGSNVYKSDRGFEIGWYPLSINEVGQSGPARHLDSALTNMFHWHQDTFDLPEGARLLGSSALYPHQIFTHGENIMALQCHPEVETDQLDDWLSELSDEAQRQKIATDIRTFMPDMDRQFRLFMQEWLEQIGLGA
ncbi:MAG: gamma-glutamyl-gamma-aminobutyrate hydrolase family protein [Alphaproteobacteria bacterium]|nr:gamma-glutamyl-gamma-aminobutyrate hydrolase family protein [Alphaproteobacteria bacterium]